MNIGFVVEPYEEHEASGMGYSALEIAKIFASGAQAKGYELTLYSSKPINPALVPGVYRNVLIPRSFVGQFWYFLFVTKREVDVLFFIVALLPFWISKKITTVLICKELANEHIKGGSVKESIKIYMRDRLLMPVCVGRATRVLASSNATKFDVMKYYKVPEKKITVVYEGFQDWGRFQSVAPVLDAKLSPFFLFSGKVKTRKNVHGLVDAFIAFRKRTSETQKLVIAGSYGGAYYQRLNSALVAAGLREEVFFLGYVDAPMMYTLFTHATAFVFPSFSEGFGMPLVEAMSLGTPVIAADISVLKEVVGDAGLFVDPHSSENISEAMERVVKEPALRETLIQKGHMQSQQFSWEKVGVQYKEVVRELQQS